MDKAELEKMKNLIEGRPDITREAIKTAMGLNVCLSAISRMIRNKRGFTYKKLYTRVNGSVKRTR